EGRATMLLDPSPGPLGALDGVAPPTSRAAAPAAVPVGRGSRGGLPPRALRRGWEYIEAHLQENVSPEMVAGIAGKSMYPFARAFKQSEGLPPHEFLVQRRLRRAQDLLAGTNLPWPKSRLRAALRIKAILPTVSAGRSASPPADIDGRG